MFDSHCHVADVSFLEDARAHGVTGFMLAGVDPDDWRKQAALAALHPDVETSSGLHPQVVAEWSDAQCDDALLQLGRPRVVGEIGLDALTPERRRSLPRQERIFRAQLALARELDAPVILHVLRTHQETLRILKADGLPKAGGVVHSYSGGTDLPYVALGLHISLGDTVAFHNASKALTVAENVPLERLLVETDGHATPLRTIVAAVATSRQASFDAIALATAQNARRLFQLDGSGPNR